jgi:DNA-directed RNA polymerase subunit alpha
MIENRSFTIKAVTTGESNRYAKFECEPLERGYGITLGNSLRRVLLSSLDGVAITSIKIDGVLHEFSTIPGIKEDVTDIILQLKKIRFIAYQEAQFPITVRVDATKEGAFTAGDLKVPAEIDVLNGDLILCHLSKKAHLGMEITIDHGHGYVPFTKNKKEDDAIGEIPIDSIFSPVVKCNYEVTDTRVGNELNYDKLTLEVETDGSVDAEDAVAKAANILIGCFETFRSLAKTPLETVHDSDEGQEEGAEAAANAIDFDAVPIDELELSVRAFNCLKRAEIHALSQLLEKTEDELSRTRNLGKKSVEEIKNKLRLYKDLGLHLKDPND